MARFYFFAMRSVASTALVLQTYIVAASSPSSPARVPQATLSNGLRFPLLGLGCASGVREEHVATAIELGYRHFDTAQAYQWGYREDEVGQALRASIGKGMAASDFFVQTKIHPQDLGFKSTKAAIDVSIQRLSLSAENGWFGPVDSILIHKPSCWEGICSRRPEGTWQDSWRALEEAYLAGKVLSIGICDVDEVLLDALLKQAQPPHIIQNWMDPFHQDKEIRRRCKESGVQYQAYSTLGTQWTVHRGQRSNPVFDNPVLKRIAADHNRTVAQVVINWSIRHGVAVIPASTSIERQRSNLESFSFELSDEELSAIDALDGTLEGNQRGSQVQVDFENVGSDKLQAFWLDFSNAEVFVGDVEPAERLSQLTSDGHRYRFKLNGKIVQELAIDRNAGSQQHILIQAPDGKVKINFENVGKESLQAFWIDPSDSEVFVATIEPGAKLGQTTMHGHRYRFKRNGQILHDFSVDQGRGPVQDVVVKVVDALIDGFEPVKVNVSFENLYPASLQVLWLDGNKKEVSFGELKPMAKIGQLTFHGHTYRFRLDTELVHEMTVDKAHGTDQVHRIKPNHQEL